MEKRVDHEGLNGFLTKILLWDDDRDFIVETLSALPGNLLRRLMASPVDRNGSVECTMTLAELRKIINGLFSIALYNEDIEEDADRIRERLLLCEYEVLEAMKKETEKSMK